MLVHPWVLELAWALGQRLVLEWVLVLAWAWAKALVHADVDACVALDETLAWIRRHHVLLQSWHN